MSLVSAADRCSTAEKHDAFVTAPREDGKVLLSFSGKELIKGEPDASSFPSGGLRATFEARGYTTWIAHHLPLYVMTQPAGSYVSPQHSAPTQERRLTRKHRFFVPWKRSIHRRFDFFAFSEIQHQKKVTPSVGAEQEYFLVDKEKWLQRKDLIYTGRTLFGAMPPKGQEMDDHYFGTIRQRISAYMKEVNEECWKLGVTAKTTAQ